MTTRIPLARAEEIANATVEKLRPHCERIAVAGSVCRKVPDVKDIEIVCMPKPYENLPLFTSGLATVVNQWPKLLGELPCRWTQRALPEGIKLDLFMVSDPRGWGLIQAIRTGSADWAHQVLARTWRRAGFHSEGGLLRREDKTVVSCTTERELFDLIGLRWVDPEFRELP